MALIKKIIYGMILLYLLFIPFGNYGIMIGPIKLDIIVGIILMILLLFSINKIVNHYPNWYVIGALLYIVSLLISVLFSKDIFFSLWRFIVTAGYFYLSLIIPILFLNKYRQISTVIWIGGVASAALAVVLYHFFNFKGDGWNRYTHPGYDWAAHTFYQFKETYWVDPNILAFGLLTAFIPVLPRLFTNSKMKYVYMLSFVLIFYSVLLTKSRTAILSFVISAGVLLIQELLKGLLRDKMHFKKIVKKLGIMMVILLSFALLFRNNIADIASRFANFDMNRVQLIQFATDGWLENIKTLLIGQGYYLAAKTSDPHNIYLEYLYGGGLFALSTFLLFLFLTYMLINQYTQRHANIVAKFFFFYICIGGLTYWHTKTFWVPILFVNLLVMSYKKYKDQFNNVAE